MDYLLSRENQSQHARLASCLRMVGLVRKFFSFFFTYESEFWVYPDRDEELLVDAHYSIFNVLSDKKALLVF